MDRAVRGADVGARAGMSGQLHPLGQGPRIPQDIGRSWSGALLDWLLTLISHLSRIL